MISPNLIKNMRSLLFRWFLTHNSDKACASLAVPGFINGVQKLNKNYVPVSAVWKLNVANPSRGEHVSDFFQKDVAIITCSSPRTIVRQTALLKEWLNYTGTAGAVCLKNKLYYIGHGYLLDSKLKPLIMATYSVEEFRQNRMSCVLKHSPTLHIAPEMLIDPYWKKLVTECMIPTALEREVRLTEFNSRVPKRHEKTVQNVDVMVHDLSQFVLPVKMPPLTTNITEELTAITKALAELPKVTY